MGEGTHADQIICSRRFMSVGELKFDANLCKPVSFTGFQCATPLVPCNGWRPSLFLFVFPPANAQYPACLPCGNVVRITPMPLPDYSSSGFQHHEVNDRPLRHRAHHIRSWRPHFFAIRQGRCPMRGGVGLGTILPIHCVLWTSSLTLPRFQSYNSDGQNPCEIAGFLDSACTGSGALSIPTPEQITCSSIPPNSHWIRPIRQRYQLPNSPEG